MRATLPGLLWKLTEQFFFSVKQREISSPSLISALKDQSHYLWSFIMCFNIFPHYSAEQRDVCMKRNSQSHYWSFACWCSHICGACSYINHLRLSFLLRAFSHQDFYFSYSVCCFRDDAFDLPTFCVSLGRNTSFPLLLNIMLHFSVIPLII